MENLKIGDKVIVNENAKGTSWENGVIVDINKDGALIDYCYPMGMYGMGIRKSVDGLTKI